MRRLLICLAIAGCARAGRENSIIGGLDDAGPRGDGGIIPEPDAPLFDAPPQQMTLTETASEEIALGGSFDCHDRPTLFTRTNSYYRVFPLSDYSIATTLHVLQVDFGIDTAQAGTGGKQAAAVNIGTYGGTPGTDTLDPKLIDPITSANIQIPDGSGTRMTVPITADIAAGTNLIVEIAIPDGVAAGNKFQIAVNAKGERRPGYTLSPQCDASDPVPHTMQSIAATLGLGETDLVLTVTGNTDVPN